MADLTREQVIYLIAMNSGNEAAEQTVRDIAKALKDRLKPFE